LALIALRNSSLILSRNREIVQNNITLLDDFLKRQSKLFSWIRPKSGPIGYIKILSGESSDTFCGKVLENTGILLLPGSIYNSEENCFRIGFGRKDMPAVLEKLESYLGEKMS
jgi:aspartate/methionine/tyrosine aminotransferase